MGLDVERAVRKTADTIRVLPVLGRAQGIIMRIGKVVCPSLVANELQLRDEKDQLATLVEIVTEDGQYSPNVDDCKPGLASAAGEVILERVDDIARTDRRASE